MVNAYEKKSSQRAMLVSLGVHAILLLLLFFIVAWRAPNPPHPEYGIVLNFGMDTEGSGSVQPTTPVGSREVVENEPAAEEPQEVPAEEQVREEESTPSEPEIVSKTESPVVVEEKKEEVKDKPDEKPVEKPVEKKDDVKPAEDPLALYEPNKKDDSKDTDSKKTGDPGSQGDSRNAIGDKGDPQGELDAEALYGKQGGGGGGPSLALAGWQWDRIPDPTVPDNEQPGRIVFTIEVDENGELIRYRKKSGTVSAAAERAFVEAIQKLTFTKKSGAQAPPITKGEITFVVTAK